MSWNEPGGNKDPWSGRGQPTETPPDLEEVMKDINAAFGRLFGGSGGGGGSEGGDGLPFKAGGVLIAGVLLVWSLFGFYLVDEGSRGIVTRFGKYVDTTLPGLHWRMPSPIEAVQLVNLEQQRFVEVGYRSGGRQQAMGSVPKEALMLTQDENIIDIRLAVQYQIKDPRNYQFNVADPDVTLKQVIESAQRAVIGKSTMDFVLTEGRSDIVAEIKGEIQQAMDDYRTGITIASVNLQDAQPPEEVQGAFEDAIRAREDKQRLINEAEAYSNEIIPKARGAAARLLQEAEAYEAEKVAKAKGETERFDQLLVEYEKNPAITRKRLYLEAKEKLYSGSNKIMIEGERNAPQFYMPLQSAPTQSATAKTVQSPEINNDSVANDKGASHKTAASTELRPSRSRP